MAIKQLSVHTIPVRYFLDDRSVDEPLNMTGMRLEMALQTVSVPKTYVQNVITCVEDARIHVEGLVIKPLASSLGALTNEEMRIGTVSLSIGGGSTGLVLYQAGRPFKIRSFPIGGDHSRTILPECFGSRWRRRRTSRNAFSPRRRRRFGARGSTSAWPLT